MLVPVRVSCSLKTTFHPAEPLWRRVPTRDENGRALSDFMMVIPGLRTRSPEHIQSVVRIIECVLRQYHATVVFADLNLNINVLWISLRSVPGVSVELASVIHTLIPEAKLVAQHFES